MGCSSSQNIPPSRHSIALVGFKQQYKLGEVLGQGVISSTHVATSKATNNKVVVKVIEKTQLSNSQQDSFQKEINAMKEISHENIVQCIDFFDEEKSFYIVLQFMQGGELFDQIMRKNYYDEKEARDIVRSILLGISCYHSKNITHGNLKPENLLLPNKSNDAKLKISDFRVSGLSADITLPSYTAPEILCNESFGSSADMWSVGVIMFVLIGGYCPFYNDDSKKAIANIKNGTLIFHGSTWGNVSTDAQDLIRDLIVLDPSKRLTAEKALEHPWITSSDEILKSRNLDGNLEELKKFLAMRKFRAAAFAVMAANSSVLRKSTTISLEGEDTTNIDNVNVDIEEDNQL